MNSIQARLTVYLLACVLAMSAAGSFAVYLVFRDRMIEQFDDSLTTEARSISSYFVRDHDGHYEFVPPPDMDSLYRHGNDLDVYCIRRMDGTVVVHAPWIKPEDCPVMERPVTQAGHSRVHGYRSPHDGDGHRRHGRRSRAAYLIHGDSHWRAAFLTFLPASETRRPVDRFQVAVAAEWEEADHLLKDLIWVLAAVALAAGAATVGLVIWTVRRGLAPLRNLAHQAAGIDAAHLDRRFSLEGAPLELKPIHRALNDLLDRIAGTLKRERRFNADVAHELRTPVAELRSLCEVAIAAAADPKTAAEALSDARDIGAQMESLINALLELRRSEAGRPLAPVDAVAVAKEAWQPLEPVAMQRGITINWQSPPGAEVLCDKTMLAAVLRNLFDNAVNYTAPGGEIACLITPAKIRVCNRPHGLTLDDIEHLAEPFWRKDAARSSSAHAGLGLALADAYCRAFGGALKVSLDVDGWLVFDVLFADSR